MMNFGNRIGFSKTSNVVDARDLLTAKRSTYPNSSRQPTDVRNRLSRRPELDFTIPTKTISNEKFNTNNINSNKINDNNNKINHNNNNPEIANFSIRKPNKITLPANRTSGRTFSDPKVSQGIFSRSIDENKGKRSFSSHSNDVSRDYLPPQRSNMGYRAPPWSRDGDSRSHSRLYKDAPIKINNNNSTNKIDSRALFKRSLSRDDSRETPVKKKLHKDDLETVKFVVVNEDKVSRPSLTTARLSQKSLISPIQGYRIEVKNLHPQVNVDDIFELFTSLSGDLRSCNLVRPGYAEVVFRTLADAQKSIEEFHGRELDGRPMNLKLVTPAQEPSLQNTNGEIMSKIAKIQSTRKPTINMVINKDAIFRSIYLKSADSLKTSSKPFKFSVTL